MAVNANTAPDLDMKFRVWFEARRIILGSGVVIAQLDPAIPLKGIF
jgi:hypothetical protein